MSVQVCSIENDGIGVSQLVPLENHSSPKHLHLITAWVIRWTKNARQQEDTKGGLTQEEIRRAENLWVAEK